MIRPLLFAVAMLSATPAVANYFRAEPVAAPSRDRFAARDNAWICAGTTCVSARSGVRPRIVCASLAREVGRLSSFSVEGRAFTAEELEACNSRAR